ncbi:hypothetical protein ACRAWF_11100 [Streptomyces sp. L7]
MLTRIHDVGAEREDHPHGIPGAAVGSQGLRGGNRHGGGGSWLNSVADMLDTEMDGAASDAESQDGINAVPS